MGDHDLPRAERAERAGVRLHQGGRGGRRVCGVHQQRAPRDGHAPGPVCRAALHGHPRAQHIPPRHPHGARLAPPHRGAAPQAPGPRCAWNERRRTRSRGRVPGAAPVHHFRARFRRGAGGHPPPRRAPPARPLHCAPHPDHPGRRAHGLPECRRAARDAPGPGGHGGERHVHLHRNGQVRAPPPRHQRGSAGVARQRKGVPPLELAPRRP
mmetsp:Transcript_12210/g.38671  ORF Transcript_12210/g.38671 Transcript_12210/m.38671 type:complete len:211 (+) Transcript_12210:952-1584(+)